MDPIRIYLLPLSMVLAADLRSILDTVAQKLPPDSRMLDLIVARGATERICGFDRYHETLNEAQRLAETGKADDLEHVRSRLQRYQPGDKMPDCETGRTPG